MRSSFLRILIALCLLKHSHVRAVLQTLEPEPEPETRLSLLPEEIERGTQMKDSFARYGLQLEYAPKAIQKNLPLVRLAVSENGNALKYADKELKKNFEVIINAIAESKDAYAHVDQENFKRKCEMLKIIVAEMRAIMFDIMVQLPVQLQKVVDADDSDSDEEEKYLMSMKLFENSIEERLSRIVKEVPAKLLRSVEEYSHARKDIVTPTPISETETLADDVNEPETETLADDVNEPEFFAHATEQLIQDIAKHAVDHEYEFGSDTRVFIYLENVFAALFDQMELRDAERRLLLKQYKDPLDLDTTSEIADVITDVLIKDPKGEGLGLIKMAELLLHPDLHMAEFLGMFDWVGPKFDITGDLSFEDDAKIERIKMAHRRCTFDETEFLEAVIIVQKYFRKRLLAKTKDAINAIKVQKLFRGRVVRKEIAKKIDAVKTIERNIQGQKDRRHFAKVKEAVKTIQSNYRGCLGRKIEAAIEAATVIQATYRGQRGREAATQAKNAVIKFQSVARGYLGRQEAKAKAQNRAATVIQTAARGYFGRQEAKAKAKAKAELNAATVIQAAVRGRQEAKAQNRAATVIQTAARGYHGRQEAKAKAKAKAELKAATVIQTVTRKQKIRRRFTEQRHAATKIQSSYREYKVRKEERLRKYVYVGVIVTGFIASVLFGGNFSKWLKIL